jgi:hypothetical protein
MDWFEQLTGFREGNYDETRAKLKVDAGRVQSLVNGKSYGVGEFELVPLLALRERARSLGGPSGRLKASVVRADVRQMHRAPEYAGALFQVASQFNALEMIGPNITPEDGVTRYQHDHTQGPACAIAAGAATIYRNYFVPVGGGIGQTAKRQLDGLAAVGEALSGAVGRPVADLWHMRNGYAMCTREGLDTISAHLARLRPEQIDALGGRLCIALQRDVEVTDAYNGQGPLVSQAFCSALPIAYTNVPARHWRPFASLVLEAAYEATMWAAVLNAQRGASKVVLLTLLGGGAFGNESNWVLDAMRRSFGVVSSYNIDARIVSYGAPSREIVDLAREFA